jgi:nicotinate phosphoribosyltransferase
MTDRQGLLLTDLYELAMLHVYAEHGLSETAAFEFFVRKLPERRGFLMAAGLEQVVEFLETARFTDEDLRELRLSGQFSASFIDTLADFRFDGDVEALPEGTIFFKDEPVLRVVAPLPQAQLVESRLINLLHFQIVVASKAARMVLAAPRKLLVDFGLRRAHGAEAGLLAARASYLAGFSGTATLAAALRFGIPAYGTMAHSFIQAHADERQAFERFAHTRPEGVILLIDTYDTELGAVKAAEVAQRLAHEGIRVRGVRIDSGDLADHARRVRQILDERGLRNIIVFASGGVDEDLLAAHTREGVPIDGYGIGTSLTTSSDAPALDCAYKLQEYAGVARRKRSEGKATWPGRKQVWRRYAGDGTFAGDVLGLDSEVHDGGPLLRPVMRQGRRVDARPSLEIIRAHAAEQLARLPGALKRLEPFPYLPEVTLSLQQLANECDRRAVSVQST